jgi:hypothetical protein
MLKVVFVLRFVRWGVVLHSMGWGDLGSFFFALLEKCSKPKIKKIFIFVGF